MTDTADTTTGEATPPTNGGGTQTPPPNDPTADPSLETRLRNLTARRVALYAILGSLVAFYLSPLHAGLMTSLKTSQAFATSLPFAPPVLGGFTVDPWLVAFETLQHSLVNSILLAVPGAILSAVLGSLAAYGLTTLNWRGQVGIVALFVAGIFIPYQAVLIPLSRLWSVHADLSVFFPYQIDHLASILELIITHTAYGIPICMLLFRAYYKSLSDEMIEAAHLDGASAYTIYRRIVLPLSIPMFSVTLIYQFTQIWNDLLFALIIIPSGSGPAAVVTIALNELTGGIIQQFNTQMAGAFVAALPTLLVYVVFGEQFAKGVAGET